MTIEPDDKDWTWVLERTCPECGFDASSTAPTAVASLLRSTADAFATALVRDDVRTRPDPATWSPLEYGCHVRDVHRLYLERLRLMLAEDDPLYPNWDQDATAIADRYADQNPTVVARELVESGDVLADAFDAVTDEQWSRVGRRNDGARFTVDTFARYLVHDPIHHLHDIDRTTDL